jgi:hypothetical protein
MPTNFDGTIGSVTELRDRMQAAGFGSLHHAHIRYWFRGQADASWDLTPGVYRPNFKLTNTADETERLNKERHLTQDFRAMSAGLLTAPKSEAELYFIQQHYRMPTRLLDWTTNPLAGLYFAVERADAKEDAALWMMDAYALGPDQGGKWPNGRVFNGIASSRSPLFEDALHPIFRWQDDPGKFPEFILPVRPDQFDRRIALQRGCFTFHPPTKGILTQALTRNLKAYKIPAASKGPLLKELALLGVDTFSIYGDLDHLADYLKFVHGVA